MKNVTDVLKREHEAAKNSHIFLKEFNKLEDKKVRDHCYHMVLYQGAARKNCNIKYWTTDHISIVFHNLRDYHVHLFIKQLGKKFNNNVIGFIAENKEKNISFNFKINVKVAEVTNRKVEIR